MGSKNKKNNAGKSSSDPALTVRHLLEKRDFKGAVKEGKQLYRLNPTAANHQLLEQAYLRRANELENGGFRNEAREVMQNLLEFGVTDTSLQVEIAAVAVKVGLQTRMATIATAPMSVEEKSQLHGSAADQAVLRPEESQGEFAAGAKLVRDSLAALADGNLDQASQWLRDLPRSSPFAEWRLLVRGLVAYQQHQDDAMNECFRRLDRNRVCVRVANFLDQFHQDFRCLFAKGPLRAKLRKMEMAIWGDTPLTFLIELRDALMSGNWDELIHVLRQGQNAFKKLDPQLPLRITEVIYFNAMSESKNLAEKYYKKNFVERLVRLLEPLPIDPHWNRFWALMWTRNGHGTTEAIQYWHRYLKDIDEITLFRETEKRIAKSITWSMIGDNYWYFSQASGHRMVFSIPKVVSEAIKEAETAYLKARDLAPEIEESHTRLAEMYFELNDHGKCIDTCLVHLDHQPDHRDALKFLYNQSYLMDEPLKPIPYLQKARVLRPLDSELVDWEWNLQLYAARKLGKKGDIEKGRVAFAAADALKPQCDERFLLLGRWAAFEFHAKNPTRAEELLQQAFQLCSPPLPVLLILVIESDFYEAKTVYKRFNKELNSAWKQPPSAETCAKLADVMLVYAKTNILYDNRFNHLDKIFKYLKRSLSQDFSCTQLARIGYMLEHCNKPEKLLDNFSDRAMQLFPHVGYFWFLRAVALEETRKFILGHGLCKTAYEYAKDSTAPWDIRMMPRLKHKLAQWSRFDRGEAFEDDEDEPVSLDTPEFVTNFFQEEAEPETDMPARFAILPDLDESINEFCRRTGINLNDIKAKLREIGLIPKNESDNTGKTRE